MPPPWAVVEIPGGFRVDDADGKALAYVYGLDPKELPAAGQPGSVLKRPGVWPPTS